MNIKPKSTDYSNLRQKTVFDFCDDPKILGEVFACHETILEMTDFLKEHCKKFPIEQARSFDYFAEITNNRELKNAVEKEFKNELEEYYASFNE